MAQRRMFSVKIVNSARFLKMPIDAQNLYFHLGLRADDDGIVEAFTVMRLIGSPEDNLTLLHAKGFVRILNEDLVTYITDWKEHNLIRADRKIDSIYKDLLVQIIPEVQLIAPRERADSKRTSSGQPKDGVGKVRLGKDKLSKDRLDKDKTDTPYMEFQELFNRICVSFPQIKTMSKGRKEKVKCRWGEIKSLETLEQIFTIMENSEFLKGNNKNKWKATFDWLMINDNNWVKVLEGNYDNTLDKQAQPQQQSVSDQWLEMRKAAKGE